MKSPFRRDFAQRRAQSWVRIWGLMYRHIALFRKSWPRLVELAYWPIVQLLIWGLTARFIATGAVASGTIVTIGGTLLGGVLLWEVAMRAQMATALGFMEEIWSRNLGHLCVSPLRPWEMLAALTLLSILRTLVGVIPAIVLAIVLYAFNLFTLGPILVLFFINLMLMGWSVSFAIMTLILRHGQGAEALAWSVLAGLTPLCAVFYPIHVIPMPWRVIAEAIPASHVFEGMRAALHGTLLWDQLAAAAALNVAWGIAALLLLSREFQAARRTGALLTLGE